MKASRICQYGLALGGLVASVGCNPADPIASVVPAKPGTEDGSLKIFQVTPPHALTGKDVIALIRGQGFKPGLRVQFGDLEASDVKIISDGMLTAVIPQQAPGALDVTLSVGAEDRIVMLPSAFEFMGGDERGGGPTDGDGLDSNIEIAGWEIQVDLFGFGMNPAHIIRYTVSSNPTADDSDLDGLNDAEEYLYKSDPYNQDTDNDGLFDGEEVHRWGTSPVSVDTDADARSADPSSSDSTLPPNANLFDGLELYEPGVLVYEPWNRGGLKTGATSPTLDDTDGDGVRDGDENEGRSPLLADMPQLEFRIVDDVDMRLDVEYSEEQGTSTSFESSFATGQESTSSRSNSVSASVTVGVEVSSGPLSFGGASVEVSSGWESSWSTDSTTSSEQSTTQAQERSRTHSETSATGSMSAGVEIKNVGKVSVKLANLAYTVRQWVPNAASSSTSNSPGQYQTLATLSPEIGDGLTLAPGDSSGVIQASASEVNADRVREFMARPDSLRIAPSAFEYENADGINFAFIEEVTRAQTARVSIDFGDGRFEEYRVATNVNRDENGELAGVTMSEVMDMTVGPGNWETGGMDWACQSSSGIVTRIRDVAITGSGPVRFWTVFLNSGETGPFADLVLHAGDGVLLSFSKDADGDGLFAAQEQQYGSSDGAADTDGDGLSDAVEAARSYRNFQNCTVLQGGWTVNVTRSDNSTLSYRVYSDPRHRDTDGDGRTDLQERNAGTDPTKVDTDGDGLWDNIDPFPLFQAVTLYVKPGGGTTGGTSWGTAFGALQAAISEANTRNSNSTGVDDVTEIWVAAGTYAAGPYRPVSRVAVYGGFSGNETKLAQRNADPLTNGTALRRGSTVDATVSMVNLTNAVLDGFTLDESPSRAMHIINSTAAVRNCFFVNNSNSGQLTEKDGGAVRIVQNSNVTMSNCTFSNNTIIAPGGFTAMGGGGAIYLGSATLRLDQCLFVGNRLISSNAGWYRGGAVLSEGATSTLTIDRCRFEANNMVLTTNCDVHGGAVASSLGRVRVSNTVFRANVVNAPEVFLPWSVAQSGGGVSMENAVVSDFVNCEFYGNQARMFAGGLFVGPRAITRLVNCTFSENKVVVTSTAYVNSGSCGSTTIRVRPFAVGAAIGTIGSVTAENCVFYDNVGMNAIDVQTNTSCQPAGLAPHGPGEEISTAPYSVYTSAVTSPAGSLVYNNCCVKGENRTGRFPGMTGGLGNFDANPLFEGGRTDPANAASAAGNLRLSSNSPCIDAGNRLVDIDLTASGFQMLPPFDLNGDLRIVDGDFDENAQVDIGAYEFQQ